MSTAVNRRCFKHIYPSFQTIHQIVLKNYDMYQCVVLSSRVFGTFVASGKFLPILSVQQSIFYNLANACFLSYTILWTIFRFCIDCLLCLSQASQRLLSNFWSILSYTTLRQAAPHAWVRFCVIRLLELDSMYDNIIITTVKAKACPDTVLEIVREFQMR